MTFDFFPLLVTCQPINNINPMWSGNGPIKTIDSPGYAEALRMAQAEDETLGIRNIYGTRSSKYCCHGNKICCLTFCLKVEKSEKVI